MKRLHNSIKIIAIAAFSSAFFFTSTPAMACSSGGCGGCKTTLIEKDPVWFNFYKSVKAAGINPISCFRTYQCQANLARTCGRFRASAPGRSNHEHGIAMDFKTSNGDAGRVKPIAQAMLRGSVRQCMHGGVGWHISNSKGECEVFRVKSGVVQAYKDRKAASPPAASPRPASGPCSRMNCVERSGQSGLWYKRRSGEWKRMTLEPIR